MSDQRPASGHEHDESPTTDDRPPTTDHAHGHGGGPVRPPGAAAPSHEDEHAHGHGDSYERPPGAAAPSHEDEHAHGHGGGPVRPQRAAASHPTHAHDHGADHDHAGGPLGWLGRLLHLHGHDQPREALASDPAFAGTNEGIRTVWLALGALGLTTVVQAAIFYFSGSVALLADTVHNVGDALNSIPLLIAFYLARRAPTRRYTYGFGKAEDLAGLVIVLSIVVSAAYIFWESFQKLLAPEPIAQPLWVAAAAIAGFIGNEAVAMLQIRSGRRIGSAAMVADGEHARIDGLTSLAVLVAVGGSALGFPIVDPIVGLLIGAVIVLIARRAVVSMWHRLMDAVDPQLVDEIERVAAGVDGVQGVHEVRVRWLGHRLNAELHVVVDEDLPTRESHRIAEEVRHALFHNQLHLSAAQVHIDPCGHSGIDPHDRTMHHSGAAAR